MKHVDYKTQGTCSRMIHFDLDDDNRIHNLSFDGGCNGNLKGIVKLCEGMIASEAADRIRGTKCGFKNTSCPDQLSKAIDSALSNN